MTRRQQTLRLILLGVLAVLAAAWLCLPAAERGNGSVTPEPGSEPKAVSLPDRQPPTPKMEPLPSVNAPVAGIATTLQQRADAGDTRAACRLAAELIRCRQDAAFLAIVAAPDAPMSDKLAREGRLDEAISIDERALVLSQQQQQCRALPEGLLGRAGDYLLQAARAGEAEAMILFVEGQHFPPAGMARLSDPGFEAWRREAPAMALALLRRGEPEAAFVLSLAYGGDDDWFSGLVQDDAVQTEAYRQLMSRLTGRSGRTQPTPLGASDVARAGVLAEDWHARYFNLRKFDRKDLTRRLMPMTHRRPDPAQPLCEPGGSPAPAAGL